MAENRIPFYDEAIAIVADTRNASTSHLQRRMSIGYNAACRYIEHMESEGVISKPDDLGRRRFLRDPRLDQRVSLADCPPGLFWYGDTLAMKTEYTPTLENPRRFQCDAYIVASGEYFAGGVGGDVAKRAALMVLPIEAPESLLRAPR